MTISMQINIFIKVSDTDPFCFNYVLTQQINVYSYQQLNNLLTEMT